MSALSDGTVSVPEGQREGGRERRESSGGKAQSGSQPEAHDNCEDESEWDYEYSTTETETYYLTLDLSGSDLAKRPTRPVLRGGRGRLTTWGQRADRADASRAEHGMAAREQAEAETEVAEEDDGSGGSGLIQILDLHGARPLISYRGRVFEGRWAANIGTEALFARRGVGGPPLPALAAWGDGIDLLAMSGARLLTTEVAVQPRGQGEVADEHGRPAMRRQQVDFLERLGELKRRRGETDEVTFLAMTARRPLANDRRQRLRIED